MGKFTSQAKKRWESIPTGIRLRLRIQNNVWCVRCKTTVGMGNLSGSIRKRMLFLEGVCTRCSGTVAWIVEDG